MKDANGHGVCAYDNTFTTDEEPTTPPVCSAIFPGPTPYALGDGVSVTVTIDCPPVTDPIDYVCFDFFFVDDLLDEGETLRIFYTDDAAAEITNFGPGPTAGRTLCFVDEVFKEIFGDGVATFTIDLDPGTSLTIGTHSILFFTTIGG